MMVHPAFIVDEETNGKGKSEILRLIREWEADKAFRLMVCDHPETYPQSHSINPDPGVFLWFSREVIRLLKEKYAALGGDYKADKKESEAYLFDKRLVRITGLRLTKRAETVIGAYVYDLKTDGDGTVIFRKGPCADPDAEPPAAPFAFDRKGLIGFLKKMGFGVWKRSYESENDSFLDGEMWDFEITFSSGDSFRSSGRNAYPGNFDAFLLLFGEKQEF